MPKSATPRRRYGETSLQTSNIVTDPSTNKRKHVTDEQTRNAVGDQGAEKLRESRKTMTQKDDLVSSSDKQSTPAERRAAAKAAMDKENDELVGRVKKAMGKKGGPLMQSNYDE